MSDQKRSAERDRDQCRPDTQQSARADSRIDEVAAESGDCHPSEKPVNATAAAAVLAPVLCLT